MTDRATSVMTVFFATDAVTQAHLQPDDTITVTSEPPDEYGLLFELHPIASDLREVSAGVFELKWGAALAHPHRTSTR